MKAVVLAAYVLGTKLDYAICSSLQKTYVVFDV